MRTRALVPSFAIMVAVLLVAGCGDDGDDTARAPSPSAATESGDGGDEGGAGRELDGAGEPGADTDGGDGGVDETIPVPADSSAAKQTFLEEADAVCAAAQKKAEAKSGKGLIAQTKMALGDELEGIGALAPPSGDEGEVEAILTGVRQILAALPGNVPLATQRLAAAEKLADEYGLKVCLLPS